MSNNSRAKNTTHACAACKYQRRKCTPDCVLAPYFPHHRQRQFLNAHKLFGVKKITKTIENLDDPSKKDQAMRTIVYQSDVRANDPVGGCYRIICELKHQIEYNMVELELVLQQLALCRAPVPVSHQAYAESSPNCHEVIKPRTGVEINDPMSYDHLHLQQRHEEEEYLLHEPSLQDVVSWGAQDATVSSSFHEKQCFVNECHNFKLNGLDGGGKRFKHDGGERFEIQFDYEHGEEKIEGESDEAISKDNKVIVKDEIAAFIESASLGN